MQVEEALKKKLLGRAKAGKEGLSGADSIIDRLNDDTARLQGEGVVRIPNGAEVLRRAQLNGQWLEFLTTNLRWGSAAEWISSLDEEDLGRALQGGDGAKVLGEYREKEAADKALRVCGLRDLTKAGGEALGSVLAVISEKEARREEGESWAVVRMEQRFEEYKGLKEAGERWTFFESMMVRVVENKLRLAWGVNTPLRDLSAEEGEMIGAGLAMTLAGGLTAEAGVDAWVVKCGALRELDETEAWFR